MPSSSNRAPSHGEEEEEKRMLDSPARNIRVAPPAQADPSRPTSHHNGDLDSVFDDSTLSELSEEDRRYTCSIYYINNYTFELICYVMQLYKLSFKIYNYTK